MPPAARIVRHRWNPIQSKFILAKERFIDFEGAIRSGKTTPAIMKMLDYALKHRGARMLLTRWTQDSLEAQLKPRFYELCPEELLKAWHAKEEFQELTNGTRIYMRALRSSEEASRYRKISGLTLSYIYVDQPEEVPEDYFHYLVGRLSQPGYPHHLVLTPNPPDEDHWLAREFPERENKPDHLYLRTSVFDNATNLGAEYINSLKAQFPVGSAQYRRMVEGRRGLSVIGEPVYKGYFNRTLHVREVTAFNDIPLIRAWDFGHRHPAVTFMQFTPWGGLRVLHEVMGDAQFIDDFAPIILTVTQSLFGNVQTCWDCCDPAGADTQGHGLRRTAVHVLRDLGISPIFQTGSNDPARRDFAIQKIAAYMTKLTKQGPAFEIHPRCRILIDGFEAGYVWEDINRSGSVLPNTRRPKKDGYYDHTQNTVEYAMINYAGAGESNWRTKKQLSRAMVLDRDEAFKWERQRGSLSRAGY